MTSISCISRLSTSRKICLLQMSKSTGNFLTLSDAIQKFSADGNTFVVDCICMSLHVDVAVSSCNVVYVIK